MTIDTLKPYLFFNGRADEAIRLYETVFGAKVEDLMRYGEMPAEAGPCAPEDQERVLHAQLHLESTALMLSDCPTRMPVPAETNVHLCLEFDDAGEMERKFDALAGNGQVGMAIHDAFWGGRFGMVVDAVGVHWMFVCRTQPA